MPRRSGYGPGVPCWVDCITTDLSGAQRFYGALLGWDFANEGGYRLVHLGEEVIGGLGLSPLGPSAGAWWNVYLATKDADRTRDQVRRSGGTVVMEPVPAGENGRLFLAIDPAGASVGFWEGHRAEGVVLVDEPGAVCGYELRTPSPAVAEQFYGSLFGYRLSGERLELDGVCQARVVADGAAPAHWIPQFAVADRDTAVRQALDGGAQLVRRPADGPAVLRDPFGAVFAVGELGPRDSQ